MVDYNKRLENTKLTLYIISKRKVVKNMRNILFFVIVIFCLILVNESLSNKISHANEVNIPVIDQDIPTNIETATFAMG